MARLNTYLNFKRNCGDAFMFYKSVFGGEFDSFNKFGEMPPSEEYTVPESDKDLVMHVSLTIGDTVLMGSDVGCAFESNFILGNNFSVSVSADSKEQADQFFNALSVNGNVTMPMNATFWGDYFGMLTDQFGINWMVSFPMNS